LKGYVEGIRSDDREVNVDKTALRARSRIRFGATVVGMLVVGVAGYIGFVAFVGSGPEISAGVMVLAAATGFAAFFSPCSFPLLLTFLARKSTETRGAAILSAVRIGAGAVAFFGLMAVVMVLAGTAFGSVIGFDTTAGRIFRLMVGVLLIGFGLRQARLLRIEMRWLDRVAGTAGQAFDPSVHSSQARSDIVYGFGYLLAGFG
jgi:cytochrome c biogenesis protein CcdA